MEVDLGQDDFTDPEDPDHSDIESMEEDKESQGDCGSSESGRNNNAILREKDSPEDFTNEERKSMEKFARFLEQNGYIQKKEFEGRLQGCSLGNNKRCLGKGGNKAGKTGHMVPSIQSETTIYERAIPLVPIENDDPEIIFLNQQNRNSTSSEEDQFNSSDELAKVVKGGRDLNNCYIDFAGQELNRGEKRARSVEADQVRPGTSRNHQRGELPPTPREIAEERARVMVKRVEKAKAQIYDVPGKANVFSMSDMFHSVIVDEKYSLVGGHVDTRKRIVTGEFIDFSRLLPRDRVLMQQDNRLELYNNNGQPGIRAATDREGDSISSFHKWEQAFRVYSMIYTDAHPERAKELIQYNHIIFSASHNFVWRNVYSYDIDFRLHMSENPEQNWGIILQQAWTVHMQDRLTPGTAGSSSKGGGFLGRKICWKYNRGKCTYGFNCKFDHKCGICGKFGHGSHNCRKGQDNNNNNGNKGYKSPGSPPPYSEYKDQDHKHKRRR